MSSIEPVLVRRSRPAMGSLAEVFLAGDDAQHLTAAGDAALDEIWRLSECWSRFSPASEISRINREAPQGWVRVDRELFAVLVECDRWRRRTDGAFDISAGSWMAGETPRISGAEVELDSERCAVRFHAPGLRIDLGGYGKGAALDLAAELILAQGVGNALLQIGGSSIRALGGWPAADGWRIALRSPDCAERIVMEVALSDAGLSSSATTAPGQRESDLVDPRTGEPLTDRCACCVIAPSAAAAEALSTAAVVSGASFRLPPDLSRTTLHWL